MAAPLVLVTGAGRGYGATVARHVAAAGFHVAVLGRDAHAIGAVAEEVGGRPVVADVLDRAAVERGIAGLVADHGPISVLVNNAGLGGPLALMWEADPDEWWATFEVNVRGTHNVTTAVLPGMFAAGAGRIINIVSHAGTARWPYGSAYAISKAAVIKLGENLAAEVRRHGVVVLNYHPGILEIGLTQTHFESAPEPGTTEAMVADWFRGEIAAGRSIDADLSAERLVRLVRGDADALTGRYLTAYDDLDAILAESDEIAGSTLYTLGLLQPDGGLAGTG
jgi:NADP-dependent 3-hydroxy acid dehydrogenase YdfG